MRRLLRHVRNPSVRKSIRVARLVELIVCGLIGKLQGSRVDIKQKARRVARRPLVVETLRFRKVQTILRTGEGHERQPPLLFHGFGSAGFPRRQNAFGKRAQKHLPKLQALCGMDGHELHAVLRPIGGIGVCKQRHMF